MELIWKYLTRKQLLELEKKLRPDTWRES
jgi:hypothetical protein